MSKGTINQPAEADSEEMLPEYEFTGGARGKHVRAYRQGYTITIHYPDGATAVHHVQPEAGVIRLDLDVQPYFPNSESVNKALRSLIARLPK